MMDFSLAESQQAVAGLAAQVLAGADPWKELAQAGLLDMSQLGVLDTAVLLTEIGKHASPDALKALATLMSGALPVVRWGDADLQRELLPGRRVWRANPHRRPPRALQPGPSCPCHHNHIRTDHWHQDRRPLRRGVSPHPRARPVMRRGVSV